MQARKLPSFNLLYVKLGFIQRCICSLVGTVAQWRPGGLGFNPNVPPYHMSMTLSEKLEWPLEHFVNVEFMVPKWRPKGGNLSIRPNIGVVDDDSRSRGSG